MALFKNIQLSVCSVFFTLGISFAQPIVLSYDDAIKIALDKSYTIKTYDNNKAMTRFGYEYSKAMFKPRFDFDLFAPSWEESVQTIYQPDGLPVYNSTGSTQVGGNLEFTYVLPTGGDFSLSANSYFENQQTIPTAGEKLKNKLFYNRFALSLSQPVFTKNTLRENLNEAELEFERSTVQYSRGQMDIIYEVTREFYAVYKATRLVEIGKERLENSEEAFRVAKLLSESGRVPEGDLMMAELEVAQDQADLLVAKGTLDTEKDIFKQLIGLDLLTEDILIVDELQKEMVVIDPEIALYEALKSRLELQESELNIRLQEIEVDRSKRVREFSGNISAYYDFTGVSTIGSGSLGDLFDSSIRNLDQRPPNRGVVLTISYPITDWGRGKAKVQQAKIELEDEKLKRENIINTIIKEVRNIVRTVQESQVRLKIHEKNQELAQRTYRIFTMRFENGDISSQELAIERERLSSIQLNYLNAYIDNKLALADLKRKTMWDFQNNRSYRADWKNQTQD
ncbi:MAG: TolC family protein [Mangrovibacterium sp.]